MEVVVRSVCEAGPRSGGDVGEVAVGEVDAAVVGDVKELAAGENHVLEKAVLEGGVGTECKEERRSGAHKPGENRVCMP